MTASLLFGGLAVVGALNAVLWLRDRRIAQSRRDNHTRAVLARTPRVSVLVAAWNERDDLPAFLSAIADLNYPDVELVLCAGGDDGTYAFASEICESYPAVKLLEQQQGEGKQHALQRCYELASGEILFLTDADCILDDRTFETTLAPIINQGAAVATGGSSPIPDQLADPFVLQQWFTDLYSRSRWGETTSGILGRNAAISRAALNAIGAFSASVASGTDYYMAKQLMATGTPIHVARSQVATRFADTLPAYRRQQTRWLRNVVTHGSAFGASDEVRANLLPSLVGAGMLALPVASIIIGPLAFALWLVAFFHAVLSRARYCRFGEIVSAQRFGGYEWLPWYVLIDFVVWASALPEYLRHSTRQRW